MARRGKWVAGLGLGCGCLIPLGMVTASIVVILAAAAIPVSLVGDSVNRYPGGVWVENILMKALGREDVLDRDEVVELRGLIDEEVGGDMELAQCFRGAPPVRPVQETLFVASKQERDAIIKYRQQRLDYNADLEAYARDYQRWQRVMADYKRRVAIAQRRGYRPDQIPDPPKPPHKPVRPPELPEKSWKMTAKERGGVSASADVDPELISIEQAAVVANTPLRDDKGRATSAVNRVINQIPEGTSEPVARLFLTVAFAGGVTGWEHFMAIMNTSGITASQLNDDNVDQVAVSFFAPESDLSPYIKAVDAALITLIVEEQVKGDMSRALATFEDCRI